MGHLTTLGEERVKGGAERERKASGRGSTRTGSRLFRSLEVAAELRAVPRGQRDRQKIQAHSAETAAKLPKQTAEEVCFSGDKLTTLLFQSLCLQVKAEAQAGFRALSHLQRCHQRACRNEGLG
ncbi:unnamed protein product [Rangifer tarandus platyrhynchus]|uniref:Uncharacterized protein n=1 Tax=Rangifer tarandus platyrhynchus TaxID=3082113 RepID=A0ABN8ZA72_RANTA|nr:unnamed protein product [Rangifer tarandus platyrhynchus]CAI9689130.1 unnamed protein product [Rangifer tarandus platyrhynchus]